MRELIVNGERIYNEDLIQNIESHKFHGDDDMTIGDKVFLLLTQFFDEPEETEKEKYERLKFKYEYNGGNDL